MAYHECAVCGKVETWGPSWKWFGSLAMEETCPELMPRLCSDACAAEFDRRMKSGAVRLPKVLSHGGTQRLVQGHEGYYQSRGHSRTGGGIG